MLTEHTFDLIFCRFVLYLKKSERMVFAMKTRIKQMICMVVLASMVCVYALATTNTKAVLKEPQVSPNEMGNFLAGKVSTKKKDSNKAKKSETVYIELGDDGSAKNTTVSDILTVVGKDPVKDVSDLNKIKNLKGSEKYTNKDGKLVWENKGKDITYQGTTQKEPPISVSISYYLDGKSVSAKELKGKSGELQIQYKFKNNARTKGHDFVPFVVLGGFILDDYTFEDVTIDNGKVAEYDESKVVLGYAVPGLGDYLHETFKEAQKYLNKVDMSDGFTISANVKDFTMSMGLIVATSNLGDFNIKDAVDMDGIKSQMNKLQSGADALVDGANQLSSGAKKLGDASTKVKNGSGELTSGLKKLKKGTADNYKGNKKFHKGLKKGLSSAKSGTKELADGADKLAKGAKDVNDGAQKVKKGASDVNDGTNQVSGGIGQVKNGFDKEGGLNDGASALKNGAKNANDGVKSLIDMVQGTPTTIDDKISTIMTQVKTASGGQITTEAQLNALIEGINAAVKAGTPLETAVAAQGLNVTTYYSLVQAYYAIQTLNGVKQTLSQQIASHADEITALKNGMQDLEDGSAALNSGIQQAYAGISTINQGATDLSDGTNALKSGTSDLANGTAALQTGANTLNSGIKTLYNGVKVMTVQLGAASPQLVTAASQLKKAMAKAYAGSNKLTKGLVPFCNGIDTLADGTKTLSSGAVKLNEEGIKRITTLFGSKADKALDKVQNLLDAGQSYKSFSGISDDMDGQVKFIYKTPEIGEWE